MKSSIFFSFIFALALSFILMSCDSGERDQAYDTQDDIDLGTQQETPTTMQDMDENEFGEINWDYTYEERDQFEQEFTQAKNNLDQRIDELETKVENTSGETKQEYQEQLQNLKEQRTELDSEWEKFQTTTAENWDDFKSGVRSAWTDIEDAWNDIDVEINTEG